MPYRSEEINPHVLKACREQMGFDLSDVEKKVGRISEFETGSATPTLKQLETLAALYKVPRWVFVSDRLPEKYRLSENAPAFRRLSRSSPDMFDPHRIRSITAMLERLRKLMLETREEHGEPTGPFTPPPLEAHSTPEAAATVIRKWLEVDGYPDFDAWRNKLEDRGIFIFLTSKYREWSHVDRRLMRGMAIFYKVLPIIVINDSDPGKARSFTLFHELGHLLRKENAINRWDAPQTQSEKWCDAFAGCCLMPQNAMPESAAFVDSLQAVKRTARKFNVSPCACLVRLKQMQFIDRNTFNALEKAWEAELAARKEKFKHAAGGPRRDRSSEAVRQYGRLYTRTLFRAYHNGEMGLYKMKKMFNLKNANHVLDMEKKI